MSKQFVKLILRAPGLCREKSPRLLSNCKSRLLTMISQIPIHLPGKPDEGMGYCISHYLGIASYVMLLAGLGLGLYTRWWETGDSSILVVALIGVFIFSLNVILCYYFSFQRLSAYISHLWFGSLLGLVTFTQWRSSPSTDSRSSSSSSSAATQRGFSQSRNSHHQPLGRIIYFDDFSMNILLMVSLLLQANWTLFARGTRRSTAVSVFLKAPELLEVLGMALAGLFTPQHSRHIILLTSAFALSIGLLRIKSSYGLVNLCLFFFLSIFFVLPSFFSESSSSSSFHFPPSAINVYALICFCGRHLVEPLVDVYFNGLLPTERWSWLLHRHWAWRSLLLVVVFVIQACYCVYLGLHVPRHSSFLIMTPIYAAFGFVYLAYHLIVFISCWCLMNKITECLSALDTFTKSLVASPSSSSTGDCAISLSRIMASRGVRHLCLIARRLAFISTLMTLILSLVGWKVKTGLTLASFLNVLPMDLLVLALVVDLSASLGGTCAGFALVIPSAPVLAAAAAHDAASTNGAAANPFPALLPPRTIEMISERATKTLNWIQRFFAVHLIANCGSEYSSSGLSVDSLLEKLGRFFVKKTDDSLPFDTYIVYYSGPSHASGDWAMSHNGVVTLQSILDAWKEAKNDDVDDHSHSDGGDDVGEGERDRIIKATSSGSRRRQSRLILIVDSEHAHKWKKPLSRTRDVFVALQTYYPRDANTKDRHDSDPEDIVTPLHGAFTQGFTKFNMGGGGGSVDGGESGSGGGETAADVITDVDDGASAWFADFTQNGIRPTYGVSRPWTDFSFKMPSAAEFDQFSQTHFPRLLLPVLKFSALPFVYLSSLCCCVEAAWKMVRRCKMTWFPPAVLNLGHDFKLMKG